MKLIHKDIVKEIVFDENKINVLAVENKDYFVFLIQDLYMQINGGEGKFILSEDNQILNISKTVYMITDIFGVSLNQRKILNSLYSKLENISKSSEMFIKTQDLKRTVADFVYTLVNQYDFNTEFDDDIKISDLLKICSLQFEENYDSIDEKIVSFIEAAVDALGIKCFVFVNLKTFLNGKRLKNLYEYIIYNKINVLLIENGISDKYLEEEVLIVDSDLCEIY